MAFPLAAAIGAGSSILESALGLGMDVWKQKMQAKAEREKEQREDARRMQEQKIESFSDFGPLQSGNFRNLSNSFTKTLLG